MKAGPARNASTIFSASVTGNRCDDCEKVGNAVKRILASSLIQTAVSRLTPGTRKAIELRELDEQSIEETARTMGSSLGAVKSGLFHGRRRLRGLLEAMNPQPVHRNDPSYLSQKPPVRLDEKAA
jgi:DNA-directed RNA polymerase specialized sigma24 family protein